MLSSWLQIMYFTLLAEYFYSTAYQVCTCHGNRGSTYGEIPCGNMENTVDKTSTLNWIKAEGDGTTTPDLGAGYMVLLACLA